MSPTLNSARHEARRRRREAALALRPHLSPSAASPGHFRVATWNVNSLKARAPSIHRFLERARPDVLCLQETKSSEIAPPVAATFDALGYEVVHAGHGAYNDVAIASVLPISDVVVPGGFDG